MPAMPALRRTLDSDEFHPIRNQQTKCSTKMIETVERKALGKTAKS